MPAVSFSLPETVWKVNLYKFKLVYKFIYTLKSKFIYNLNLYILWHTVISMQLVSCTDVKNSIYTRNHIVTPCNSNC